MALDADHGANWRQPSSPGASYSYKAVPIVVVGAAILTMLGAGLAVAVGPHGLAHSPENLTPLHEAALRVAGGSQASGARALRANGCGECHEIPGISRSVRFPKAPSLDNYAARPMIAGAIPNRPENLIIWLQDPTRFTPGTRKPEDLKVESRTASNIAAYLYRN